MSDWPEIPPSKLPPWLRQFRLTIEVREWENEWVLECRCCAMLWSVEKDRPPAAVRDFILYMAQHAMDHALNGDLTDEDRARFNDVPVT